MEMPTVNLVRIFTSGNSQAIRLPKKFRLPGQTARIKRHGKSLVITPEEDVWVRFDRGLAGLSGVMADFKRGQPDKPDRRKSFLP
jgi:antitoxin VapB